MQQTVRRIPEEIETMPTESTILSGAAGSAKDRATRGRNEIYQGLILLAEGYIESIPAAEKFRILRAKIERMNLAEDRFKVIAVTSAVPAEGKSVNSVNLARALSIDPTGKTLLIDCDLRKPSVHRFFRLTREGGMSDALLTGKLSSSYIKSVAPGLDVITAGTPVVDPAQVIDQPALPKFLDELRSRYRYIIVDCPPTLLCPEPITLSGLTDKTLLVVRAWQTDRRLVREAINALGKERLLGVVMNEGMDPAKSYLDYGYYGYYTDELRSQKRLKS